MALYRSVTVFHDKDKSAEYLDGKVYPKDDVISFRNTIDYYVNVYLADSFDAEQLKDVNVWTDKIYPAVKEVRDDLNSVTDILPMFFRYADDKKILPMMSYDLAGSGYRVYDYPRILLGEKPFERLINIRVEGKVDQHPEFADFIYSVGKGENRIPYVEGRDLHEALKRAITIYQFHKW